MIGIARVKGGLYYFEDDECRDKKATMAEISLPYVSKKDVFLWQYRLGHPNFHYLKRLFPSLFINKDPKKFHCEICQLAKHTRVSFPAKPYSESSPFFLVHSDVWGPSRIHNVTSTRWFITFIDDQTRVCWVYLFQEKSEVAKIFQSFHAMVKNQFQTTIKVLRTDNGTEYFKTLLGDFLATNGIIHQSSCTDTPQQNLVAKRKNRHLLEVARALMFTMSVPRYFWGEAILTACHLINRMPSKVLNFKTPMSVLIQIYPLFCCPSSIPLKTFGCTVFVHDHQKNKSKLDPKSIKCVFIGYSSTQKGYKCYSPTLHQMFVSMDATFFENQSFFPKSSVQGDIQGEPESWEEFEPEVSNSLPPPIPLASSIEPIEPGVPLPLPTPIEPSKPIVPQKSQWKEIVYSRKKHSHSSDKPDAQQCQESKPIPALVGSLEDSNDIEDEELNLPSQHQPSTEDIHVLIAIRKGERACTQHPISKFVSYDKLSPSFAAFTTTLTSIEIPRNI